MMLIILHSWFSDLKMSNIYVQEPPSEGKVCLGMSEINVV